MGDDIPYIPIARGFVYLALVLDWFSRRILAWRVSIDMAVDFFLEAVEKAIAQYGAPDLRDDRNTANTDSGDFTYQTPIRVQSKPAT